MCRLMGMVLLIWSGMLPAAAETGREETAGGIREKAIEWLKENTAFISCDERHFVYGVGYIDGSYMERIFYVRSSQNTPVLHVRFRDQNEPRHEANGDAGPFRFVLEMKAPDVLFAVPTDDGWKVSEEPWESALRFKYTSWFGTISRRDGVWEAHWQGYRRPMLPASITEHANEVCELFASH